MILMNIYSTFQNFKTMKERAQCTMPDPQLVSGGLIDVAKHLGNLKFRVWEKMQEIIKHTPVILDPNTASSWLCLSDDLTSVSCNDPEQQLPDNPERFMKYANVLGSKGFSSGKRSWEVEVGDHPDWTLGVPKESTDRKGELFTSPKYGIWAIRQDSGKYSNGKGETLLLKKKPQRIRVQLDYDQGEVSFYDSKDMTLIYTHKDTFTETLPVLHFWISW
ncbi:zinc-binding protein A33-like [Oncorhynchus keta]|uniref:zinc-binding protein A33-like n=1 Tax=Oncorhynchus keta TaxID=8018 RepID=UPI00227A694C|nr:zinc-binding protein A33-like [Oncorhynchus keta]